jgi:hypothetical protein
VENSWEKFQLFLNKKIGIFKKSYCKQKIHFNKKSFDFGLLFLNIQTNTFLKEKKLTTCCEVKNVKNVNKTILPLIFMELNN